MIAAIIKLISYVPGLLKLAKILEAAWNEAQARQRLDVKNAAVDDAVNRMLAHSIEQQSTVNAENRLPSSSTSSAGVGEGRIENNKLIGI